MEGICPRGLIVGWHLSYGTSCWGHLSGGFCPEAFCRGFLTGYHTYIYTPLKTAIIYIHKDTLWIYIWQRVSDWLKFLIVDQLVRVRELA